MSIYKINFNDTFVFSKHLKSKNIRGLPKTLYIKGNQELLKNPYFLGVVGTRHPTEYGKWIVKKIIQGLAGSGITIVSGFMYGVDSYAHRAALENNLATIAVLPYGIDCPPPTYQRPLYKEIESKGLLVSEYEGSLTPQKWMFSDRNRIIAAISKVVLVVEAAENSGSLITAGYARKYGRHVFAIPGEVSNAQAYGTNNLIKTGASLVTSSKDILEFYGFSQSNFNHRPIFNSVAEKKIFNCVTEKPQTLDTLLENTRFSPSELSYSLTNLQLAGYLVEENGVFRVC